MQPSIDQSSAESLVLSAPSLRATITAAILVALTVFVIGMYSIEERVPVYDEHFYLETAINLAEHGIYGLRDPASGVLTPSGIGVPLYPAMVAAVMTADVRFKRAASCVLDPNRDKRDCGPGFLRLFVVQLALMSVLMGVLCAWLGSLFGSLTTGAGTVLLIGASGAPAYFSGFVLTEALYLPLAMLATVAWARAIVSGSAVWSVVCAVLFALATLSRPTFYYVFLAMLPLVVIWMGFATRSWLRGLGLTVLMLAVFASTVGGWVWRNAQQFDRASISVGYGGRAFASRLAYNDMTAAEYRAGWIYWLPDFGDKLAKAWFGEAQVALLDLGNPDGYYLAGTARVGRAAEDATGFNPNTFKSTRQDPALSWMLRQALVEQPLRHAAVSALLAWRGVFVQKYFGLVGLLGLLGCLVFLRDQTQRRLLTLLLIPPTLLLAFNAGVSLNIPRYNLLMLLPMSVPMALFLRSMGMAVWRRAKATQPAKAT